MAIGKQGRDLHKNFESRLPIEVRDIEVSVHNYWECFTCVCRLSALTVMFVKTRSSLLNNQTGDTCETIVFNSKKKVGEVPHKKEIITSTKRETQKERELDLKKLRYEIIKFGSSGFEDSKKEESRIALAVALGAKAPKRKGRNYREILAEKKAEAKKKDNIMKQNKAKSFPLKGKSKLKRNVGKGKVGLLGSYGKVKQGK